MAKTKGLAQSLKELQEEQVKTKLAEVLDNSNKINHPEPKERKPNRLRSADSRKLLHENAMLEGCIIITSSDKAYVIVADGQEYHVTTDNGYSVRYPNIIIAMKATSSHIESNEGYDN
jgi:hypothetical protein